METTIGILGAIPQEVNGIINQLQQVEETTIGNRKYYKGYIGKQKVIVVYSRIGKVAAATTVATLLLQFKVSKILFIGVAGGIHPNVRVGDVVIAKNLIQYDMDASPLRPKFEIPLLGKTYFEADSNWSNDTYREIENMFTLENLHQLITQRELNKFNITTPKVHFGTIASGDQFFSTSEQKENLQSQLPEVLCVEMEGAAVAQVCYEFDIPFIVIRTISDNANEEASFSFQSFVEEISLVYGQEIITKMF
ncbi:MAG: 5'-methylthioadenosine/adenosylhomocysteine nucleosidase [Flavobacteriaceae bacterium]|jgi:adenosylhomocysteine nucleosidase|nr:5'-methylthioadenosine/adenosylhomocysteine nucleosidase [Flavobacteriaceae bacterium]